MSQSSKSYSIGVDLGGTEIKAGLVLSTGKVIDNLSKPSQANDGASIVSGNIASAIHQLIRTNPQLSPEDLVGIGIGTPGLIIPDRGIVHFSPNFDGWHDIPLVDLVRQKLDATNSFTHPYRK